MLLAKCHKFSSRTLFNLGFTTEKPEKAFDYYQQAHAKLKHLIELTEKHPDIQKQSDLEKDQNNISRAITALGKKLLNKEHYQEAAEYFRKAENIRRNQPPMQNNFQEDMVHNQHCLSVALWHLGKQATAHKDHQAGLPYFEEGYNILIDKPLPLIREDLVKLQFSLARALNNIGNKFKQKSYPTALAHYQKAHHVLITPPLDKNSDQTTHRKRNKIIARLYNNIGDCYDAEKKFEETYEFYNKAYLTQKDLPPPLSEKEKKILEKYQANVSHALNAKGIEYYRKMEPAKALEYFEEAQEKLRPLLPAYNEKYNRIKFNVTFILADLGEAHLKKSEYQKALQYLKKAYEDTKDTMAFFPDKKLELEKRQDELARAYCHIGDSLKNENKEEALKYFNLAYKTQTEPVPTLLDAKANINVYQQRIAEVKSTLAIPNSLQFFGTSSTTASLLNPPDNTSKKRQPRH